MRSDTIRYRNFNRDDNFFRFSCGRFFNFMLIFDRFGIPFELQLQPDYPKYRSCLGASLTISFILISSIYAIFQMMVISDKESKIQSHRQENHYGYLTEIGYEDGFAIAAAVSKYD